MRYVCIELKASLTLALYGKGLSPPRSEHFIRGNAVWYILWEHTSPTVDPVAVQGNVFTLFGRTFFAQRFIFSKSTNLHFIFTYSIGIIFKMRKSVQQLCLNPSMYGSFFPQTTSEFLPSQNILYIMDSNICHCDYQWTDGGSF